FPETEYIEIYNASGNLISLKGWSFVYDGRAVALPDSLLPPDSYAVLFRSGREIHVDTGGIAIPVATFPAALANDGKTLQLLNSAGVIMDVADYAEAAEPYSWERDSAGDWYLSNDIRGGTPGTVNSLRYIPGRPDENGKVPAEDWIIYEKDFIFNEILPEPFPGGSEYIELYNRSGRTLRMIGLSVATRGADGELRTRYALSSITEPLPPGACVVLTGNREGVLSFYSTSVPEAIHALKLPELSNAGADLVLCRTKDRIVIDEISYSSKWHNDAIRNPKGVSLERIQPEADTQDASNWTSATAAAGYGTPGCRNSQYSDSAPDKDKSVSLLPPRYVPETDEYVITYRADKAGYRLKMEVFSTEGRKLAEISNNQLSGQECEFRWDGYGRDGNRLPPDVYIFYAECYHPDGQRIVFKKAFLTKSR
ncbi:MAG: lamin tail domain-containing protein, partial [Tannerella sp.]|nr:lamin tail domain-containing protein [Tannerella sp.]